MMGKEDHFRGKGNLGIENPWATPPRGDWMDIEIPPAYTLFTFRAPKIFSFAGMAKISLYMRIGRKFFIYSSPLYHCLRGTLTGCPVLVSIAWLGLMYSYLVPVRVSLNPESPVRLPPEQPYITPALFLQHVIPLLIVISSSANANTGEATNKTVSKINKYVFIIISPFLAIDLCIF